MKVKDIMTKDVITVKPDTSILEVANILLSHRFHSVPVVDGGKVVGVITENDFFDKKTSQLYLPTYISVLEDGEVSKNLPPDKKKEMMKLKNMHARDFMTAGCVTVNPEMQLSQLMEIFKKTTFHSLTVTDKNGNLQGIVTLFDVIALMNV